MDMVSYARAYLRREWGRREAALLIMAAAIIFTGVFGVAQFGFAANDPSVTEGFQMAINVLTSPGPFIAIIVTQIINWIVGAIGLFTLQVIEIIIIPVLNYNSFSSSPIIGLGWSLVRDVVNMFVIIALLFIAIFTIVGSHRAHWEQQIPQLLIAVVMVNFSRSICGVLIDISQVIMFTFVNALLDIAAGNFAQLLLLPDFGNFSVEALSDSVLGPGAQMSTATLLANAVLQIPLYGSILAIIFLLALAFIWRIVVLWILVIMSPLAFFLGGIGGIFPQAGGQAGDWWNKFTGALVMGPLLTFFLWLALAAASSGSIAQSEGFVIGGETSGFLTLEVFGTEKLTSLILALLLLVVGMQQAGNQAAKVGEFAAKAINEGMGRKVVGGAVSGTASFLSGGAARRAAGRLAARGGAEAGRRATSGAMQAGVSLAQVPVLGALAAPLSRGIINTAGAAQKKILDYQHANSHAASDRISKMTDEQKAANIGLIAAGRTGTLSLGTNDDNNAMLLDWTTNIGTRKEAAKTLTPEQYQSFNLKALAYGEHHKKSFDEGQKDKFHKFKTESAHQLDSLGAGEMAKHLDSEKTNLRDLSKAAVQNAAVMEFLDGKPTTRTQNGRVVTAGEEVRQGLLGQELKQAQQYADIPSIVVADLRRTRAVTDRPITAQDVAGNIAAKRLEVGSLRDADITGPYGQAVLQGLLQTGTAPSRVGTGLDPAARASAQGAYRRSARDAANVPGALTESQMIFADNIEIAVIDDTARRAAGTRATPAAAGTAAERSALAQGYTAAEATAAAAAAARIPAVRDAAIAAMPAGSTPQQAAMAGLQAATAEAEAQAGRAVVDRFSAGGVFNQPRVARALAFKPEHARHLRTTVTAAGPNRIPAQNAVYSAMSARDIEKFMVRYEDQSVSAAEKEAIKQAVEAYAVAAEHAAVRLTPVGRTLKQADQKKYEAYRRLINASALMGVPPPPPPP